MLSNRDFLGVEYYAFLQRTYDEARHFLKTCGKPKDEIDIWFIQEARWTVRFCGRWLQ